MTIRQCGTRAKYVHEKCRCAPCRRACSDYEQWRTRQLAYGRTAYVDAEPIREHLRALAAAGMGWKTAADRAELSRSTVNKLLYGCRARGMGPSKRVRRRTAAAVLGVTATLDDLADNARVPALGSRRRLQALVAVGWSQPRLASRMGMTTQNFNKLIHHADGVAARTARRVMEMYAELWDQPPAEHDQYSRASASRARNHARRRGWPPPQAWDDQLIDDAAALPDCGDAGRNVLELAEVEHLAASGAHIGEIARRLGVTPAAIEQARYRARRVLGSPTEERNTA